MIGSSRKFKCDHGNKMIVCLKYYVVHNQYDSKNLDKCPYSKQLSCDKDIKI